MKTIITAVMLTMSMISIVGFSQEQSGIIININNDTIITYGPVHKGIGIYSYRDTDNIYYTIPKKHVKKIVNVNDLNSDTEIPITNVNLKTEESLTKAGEYITKAGFHQNKAMSSRALGIAAFIAGTTLYQLVDNDKEYYIFTSGGLALCFSIVSIVHQVKANDYLKKAGKLLQ